MGRLTKLNLLSQVVGSYDQTKTTIQGRVFSKTIGATTVLGPPVTKFIDVFSDTAGAPVGTLFASTNGRIFVVTAVSAGLITLSLYDADYSLGTFAYVGKLNFITPNTAATTHTVRGLRVVDTGVTGWKVFIATSATVLINGGLFCANSIDKADFVQVSPATIPFATGNGQKAMYFVQNPAAIGVSNVETASAGLILDSAATSLYLHNGTAATHQYFKRDYTASLTWTSASVSVSVATPGVVTYTSHPFLNNDPVIFSAGTLPTGLVVGTVYFVRNSAANTFELSATTAGASINTTGSPSSGAIMGRAFGTTGDMFTHKTGNLPALTGTLLLTDSEKKAVPVSSPINGGTLNGNSCAFLATSTNLYLGLLSELTNGATTWPSLSTSNILGTTNQIVAPTTVFASWFNTIDQAVYTTNSSKFVIKQLANNLITQIFGSLDNAYYETGVFDNVGLGPITVINMANESGWLFVAGGTLGQRGIFAVDLRSDTLYDYSYIVTRVISLPNSLLSTVSSFRKLIESSGMLKIWYRTSGFGSISGGWTELPNNVNLSSVSVSDQIQFKISFKNQSIGTVSSAQINELLIGSEPNDATSINWEYSHDQSSTGVPTRVAFRLKEVYQTSVPTLYFRAHDLSNTLLTNHNSVTNAANFEYSTNNGSSWIPLGTIPNTVGTLVRYTFTSPPGVDIRVGLLES